MLLSFFFFFFEFKHRVNTYLVAKSTSRGDFICMQSTGNAAVLEYACGHAIRMRRYEKRAPNPKNVTMAAAQAYAMIGPTLAGENTRATAHAAAPKALK